MSGINAEPNEYATTDADQATFDDAEPETLQAQENLRSVEARLKLLQQQLDEAEKQRRDPVDIANEIVLELLRLSIGSSSGGRAKNPYKALL